MAEVSTPNDNSTTIKQQQQPNKTGIVKCAIYYNKSNKK